MHGEHLENTNFTVRNADAKIAKTKVSTNGHWAFLTLITKSAQPGECDIVATNSFGSASVSYKLAKRRSEAEQPKGFSSADVMYLIMPDRFADGDSSNDALHGFQDADDRSLARAYHGGDLRGIGGHLDYLQSLALQRCGRRRFMTTAQTSPARRITAIARLICMLSTHTLAQW